LAIGHTACGQIRMAVASEYGRFVALAENDLVAYVEPSLSDPTIIATDEIIL